jgi:hypothetical protein
MDGLRILNRVVAVLLALVLVVGGVLVAVEIGISALDRQPWIVPHDDWYQEGRSTAWSDGDAHLLFALLTAAGLALLALEVRRRRAQAIDLDDLTDSARADLDRRGLERWLAAQLGDVEGATGARASVGKKRVHVSASTPQRDVADVERRLEQAATERLGELRMAKPLRVRTKVRSRRPS